MASDIARGIRHINRAYLRNAELVEAWSLYQSCVSYQIVVIEASNKVMTKRYPTGYHHFPYEGSLMEQPHRLMQYFDAFLEGERSSLGSG